MSSIFTCNETGCPQNSESRKTGPRTSSLSTVSKVATPITTSLALALSSEAVTLPPTSSSSIVSRVATLITKSSSSALSSSGGEDSPTSWSSTISRVATPITASSSAAEIISSTSLSSPSPTPVFSSAPSLTSSPSPPQKLANDAVSELHSLNITSNNSLQEAANVFENFTTKYRNMTLGEEQHRVDKLRSETIFKVAVAFEKVVLSYGKYHLSGTRSSKRIVRDNICEHFHGCRFRFVTIDLLGIQKGYRQNASNFYLEKHEWQASINISSGNFADNGLYTLLLSFYVQYPLTL
ncbi:chitinase-like protein PB1E7.04c [Pocillopora damicornis]|uniref:chitinase-like protein PB1E7.04c n=1 Tax=Pocillopora damicornis TaxID=46731 RepID=UPI000F54D05D|nr:chitinase-like protein PB1E7.04c [Pocillopora damicornis]